MIKLNQKGFTVFETVLIVLVVGAIGVAGYFAYQAKSGKADYSLDAPKVSKATEDPKGQSQPSAATDQEAAIKAAKLYDAADTRYSASDLAALKYEIHKFNPPFAIVNVKGSGGGSASLLKKVEDTWVVIYTGQNGPDAATAERYGLPEGYR